MAQTVLEFKLEVTEEELTPHTGLALFGEFMHALSFPELVDKALPKPGSAVGYQPSNYVMILLLMLHGGGRALEDIRQIDQDLGLKKLLNSERIPSSDAVGDWLRRQGEGSGLAGLAAVNRNLLKRALHYDGIKDYTLDIDATQIEAEKQEAKYTYQGKRGYLPIVGHIAENGMILGDEFREGDEVPRARNLEFIKYCRRQLPKGKRIKNLRADSASYQAKVINWCEENKVRFAIGVRLDASVREAIKAIQAEHWRPFRGGFIVETVHTMNDSQKAFRLIVLNRPYQPDLFSEGYKWQHYVAIATNREDPAEEIVIWYNQRGEASENRIKELKIGFGMERMPCGQFLANAMFFRLGVLAYNLFVMFKRRVLPKEWRKHQIQTIRWRFYHQAGKVVKHAGSLILKVRRSIFSLFEQVRVHNYQCVFT
jgi:Transposase DDE domain group 1